MDVPDSRPSPLGDRFDQVCASRKVTARAWSIAAGQSERYLAVQRNRSADDHSYILPEKAAAKLAAAVTPPVSVEWLRRGVGAMDVAPTVAAPRQALIEHLARSVAELSAAGDLDGARIASRSLSQLLGESSSGRVLEHDDDGHPEESHQRRKFAPVPPKTGT